MSKKARFILFPNFFHWERLFLAFSRFFNVKVRNSVLLSENLRRRLHKLHVINHLRNFPVDYAEKEFAVVQRDLLLLAQQVQDGRFVALEEPVKARLKMSEYGRIDSDSFNT